MAHERPEYWSQKKPPFIGKERHTPLLKYKRLKLGIGQAYNRSSDCSCIAT
jgi:hypothetical protein